MQYNHINNGTSIHLVVIGTADSNAWTVDIWGARQGVYVNDVTPAVYAITNTTSRFYLYGGWNFKSDNKESVYCYI